MTRSNVIPVDFRQPYKSDEISKDYISDELMDFIRIKAVMATIAICIDKASTMAAIDHLENAGHLDCYQSYLLMQLLGLEGQIDG